MLRKGLELVVRVSGGSVVSLPTKFGNFSAQVWVDSVSNVCHMLVFKKPWGDVPVVRLHSECLTGDVFGSFRCDCGEQLALALGVVEKQGGICLYLGGQEGRGIGLAQKLETYLLQESGVDTVEANKRLGLPVDSREYFVAAEILKNLGVYDINLLSNNPDKKDKLESCGINVVKMLQVEVLARAENYKYLKTKHDRMKHVFEQFSSKMEEGF